MKKMIYMPHVLKSVFKSLNLEMEDIDWGAFNSTTVGNDEFRLPKKDQELLLAINYHMQDWAGLESVIGDDTDYRPDDEAATIIDVTAIPAYHQEHSIAIKEVAGRQFLFFSFDHTSFTEFKDMTPRLASEILDKVGMSIPHTKLMKTNLVKRTFKYL